MPNAILVPLDGSTFAEHALPMAMDIARRTGARLHLAQVHERVQWPVNSAGFAEDYASWEQAMRMQEEEYLRSIANRCMETAGLAVRTELLDGLPATALAAYARELDIGLILMTTHGRGGISRAWVGSVADALVRRSNVPVLLLRPATTTHSREALAVRHILIPLDGSELSQQILDPATALGKLSGARYTLLRIALPVPLVPLRAVQTEQQTRELRDHERQQALEQLSAAAAMLRAEGLAVDTVVVNDPIPSTAILEFAAENSVDMIALATRGRGGWSRVALGSVADKVMRGSLMPVLLYRPTAPDGLSSIGADSGLTATSERRPGGG